MATVTIELPTQASQAEFNLARWEELLRDPAMERIEGRIETDRFGRVTMSPPPAARHGKYQARIAFLLQSLMNEGDVYTECPISTADGVKGADVAWASPRAVAELGNRACFLKAPEICVEVVSPANSRAEIEEKTRLYFDAGAFEVWRCDDGAMSFLSAAGAMAQSRLCAAFPKRLQQ